MANFANSPPTRPFEAVTIATADTFIARGRHQLLIDGKWVDARAGGTFDIIDPATGAVIANAAAGGKKDVGLAVDAANRAFKNPDWHAMDPHERGLLLDRIATLMEAHAEELAIIQSRDLGSNPALSRALVAGGVEAFRYYAGWPNKIFGKTMPTDGGSLTYTIREPLGVVGAIIPWNGPAQAASWKIAAALACGNTVVFKAASEAPLVCLRLFELIIEAGVPAGVVNLLTGSGSEVGQAMAEHPDIAKISFTGSVEVGKGIMAAAAETLKKVTLELGGKSPTVIFADADLDKAILSATMAFIAGAGQGCISGSRILVEDAIYEEVVERVARIVRVLKVGSAFEDATEMPPLVSKRQFERVMGYIERGKKEGARLVTGGQVLDRDGFFVEPTVFADVSNDMVIAQEEIFGPVVAIIRFVDEDEALKLANDIKFGLSASVWTKDARRLHRFMAGLQAGTVWGNTILELDTKAPFGGYKHSGLGRELGPDSIEAFTQLKTGVIRYA